MIDRLLDLLKGKASAETATLAGGSAIAQLAGIFGMVALARLYSPTEFGIYSYLIVAVPFAAHLGTRRYDVAIVAASNETEALRLRRISTLGALKTAPAVGLSLIVATHLLKLPGGPWLWTLGLPLAALLSSLADIASHWMNRTCQYSLLAKLTIVRAIVTALFGIGFAYLHPGASGLVGAYMLGLLTMVVGEAFFGSNTKKQSFTKAELQQTRSKYYSYPRYNLPHTMMDLARESVLLVSIGLIFGEALAGQYSMAARVVRAPLMFLSGAVGKVYHRRAAETWRAGHSLQSLTQSTMMWLCLIATLILVPVALIAAPAFEFLWGDQWQQAALFVPALVPWWFLRFTTGSLSQLPLIVDRMRTFFFVGIFYNLSVAAGLSLAWQQADANHFVLYFSLPPVVSLVFVALWFLQLAASDPPQDRS